MIRQGFILLIALFPFVSLFLVAPSMEIGNVESIVHTVGLTIILSGINVWLATTFAWWLLWTESRWKSVIEWLVFLPLFIPMLATLFGLYLILAEVGLIGTYVGVILALLVVTIPYSIRLAYNGMAVIGRPLLEQARLLPMSRRVVYVLYPLFSRMMRTIALFTTVILLSQFALIQLIGAGLIPTVTTELYQSYAGNNRSLALSNTWMLILFPVVIYFLLSGWNRWMVRMLKGRLQ
ncbi:MULTISPECIES: ABC transporter permease subunit [unclassified Exiguobacterium]|uniref:ABC transporter permease n=1 Tax=unclassified Exiguobacterium TaxID=2644629 RepID=UPI001BE7F185|nr:MULTISPECIES: ABC transporter permease subunit [unclassified Exiguobacterium]